MSRAHYHSSALTKDTNNVVSVVPNALVAVYEIDAITPVPHIYDDPTAGSELPNPFPADEDGNYEFFLGGTPRRVFVRFNGVSPATGPNSGGVNPSVDPSDFILQNSVVTAVAGTYTNPGIRFVDDTTGFYSNGSGLVGIKGNVKVGTSGDPSRVLDVVTDRPVAWTSALSAPYDGMRVQYGGMDPTEQVRPYPLQGGSVNIDNYLEAALTGTVEIPSTARWAGSHASRFIAGVSGLVRNLSPQSSLAEGSAGIGAVGLYGQSIIDSTGGEGWGFNTVTIVRANGFAWGGEININTQNASARVYGIHLIGDARDNSYVAIQPTNAYGLVIDPLGYFRNAGENIGKWTSAIQITDGATDIGLELMRSAAIGTTVSGSVVPVAQNSNQSQIVRMWSKDSGGTSRFCDMFASPDGYLAWRTGGGLFLWQNSAGSVNYATLGASGFTCDNAGSFGTLESLGAAHFGGNSSTWRANLTINPTSGGRWIQPYVEAPPADAELNPRTLHVWVNEIGNSINFKVKYANGTVKSLSIGGLA